MVAIGDSADFLQHEDIVGVDFVGVQQMIGNFESLGELTVIQSIWQSLSEFVLVYAGGSDVDFLQSLDVLDGGVDIVCDPEAAS